MSLAFTIGRPAQDDEDCRRPLRCCAGAALKNVSLALVRSRNRPARLARPAIDHHPHRLRRGAFTAVPLTRRPGVQPAASTACKREGVVTWKCADAATRHALQREGARRLRLDDIARRIRRQRSVAGALLRTFRSRCRWRRARHDVCVSNGGWSEPHPLRCASSTCASWSRRGARELEALEANVDRSQFVLDRTTGKLAVVSQPDELLAGKFAGSRPTSRWPGNSKGGHPLGRRSVGLHDRPAQGIAVATPRSRSKATSIRGGDAPADRVWTTCTPDENGRLSTVGRWTCSLHRDGARGARAFRVRVGAGGFDAEQCPLVLAPTGRCAQFHVPDSPGSRHDRDQGPRGLRVRSVQLDIEARNLSSSPEIAFTARRREGRVPIASAASRICD